MADSYIVSYDFGTSGVKAVIVDSHGNVECGTTSNYPLYTPEAGWGEHDTEDYWSAVCTATRDALKKVNVSPAEVDGIVFGTMWKCVIPVDAEGNVLHRSIIWLDGRAGKQARRLNKALNTDIYCDKDYIPRLMWVKDNLPKVYANTKYFLEANSYLKFRATGKVGVDISNCFTSSPEPRRNAEYERILDAAGLDKSKFGPCVMPWDEVGRLTEAAAAQLGLIPGTPVFGGCGDIPSIAIGSGCSGYNDAHIYLGSSGWLGVVVPDQIPGVGELYQSLTPDKEILLYVVQATCMAFNWVIDQFYHAEKQALGDGIFDLVNREIGEVPAGSLDLIATPWLHGERPPLSQEAKALFINITGLHDRRHMVRALLEGICYTMRWKLDTYKKETGRNISCVRIVGGGAGGDNWMQAMADILEIPVEVPKNARHAGAIGTAYCALIGLGRCKDVDEAKAMIEVERRYEPRPDSRSTYRKLYEVFKGLYPALKDTFHALNG